MATDYDKMRRDLSRFYDFSDKVVLYVGAAGKQLLDPAIRTKKLIAIDKMADAAELEAQLRDAGRNSAIEVLATNFEEVTGHGDVLYFEFCLHEMDDPEQALVHAKSLAPDVVVYDHAAGSEWVYYGAEEDKVARSSEVMRRFGMRRCESFTAEQSFADHAQLIAKVRTQGPVAIERARQFIDAKGIVIPMAYELILL